MHEGLLKCCRSRYTVFWLKVVTARVFHPGGSKNIPQFVLHPDCNDSP